MTTGGSSAYATAETAFKAPLASDFADLGVALKATLTALDTAITNGKGVANANKDPGNAAMPKGFN